MPLPRFAVALGLAASLAVTTGGAALAQAQSPNANCNGQFFSQVATGGGYEPMRVGPYVSSQAQTSPGFGRDQIAPTASTNCGAGRPSNGQAATPGGPQR